MIPLAPMTHPHIHADEQQRMVNDYFRDIFSRLPHNTQRAYISDFNEFRIFCEQEGLMGLGNDLLANEALIKRYVQCLCESPLAYKTIRRRLSALSKFMGIARLPNPLLQSAILKDFIRLELAANEKYEMSDQAPALRIDMLEQINDQVIPNTLLDMRDVALVNLMFDGLLRADEVVRVRLQDIDRHKHTLLVPKSKSDQSGKGSYRYISSTTLNMISEYVDEANRHHRTGEERPVGDLKRIDKGILFRAVTPSGMTLRDYDETQRGKSAAVLNYSSIYRIYERLRKKAGITERITPHSGRVGGAVYLAENGCSELDIQRAGGWASLDMPGHYTRQSRVSDGGMARLADKNKR